MNWNRGLKRITLVLSIIGAIIAAHLGWRDGVRVLNHNEGVLTREREREFSEYAGSLLIDEWKEAKTSDEQNHLWIRWTGSPLIPPGFRIEDVGESTRRTFEDIRSGTSQEQKPKAHNRLSGLLEDIIQERERLREQGWVIAKGDPLPKTPERVWNLKHRRRIKDLEDRVRQNQTDWPIGVTFAGILGFGVVWSVYGATKWAAWPVFRWATLGFREDKQKGEDKE